MPSFYNLALQKPTTCHREPHKNNFLNKSACPKAFAKMNLIMNYTYLSTINRGVLGAIRLILVKSTTTTITTKSATITPALLPNINKLKFT